MNVAKLCCVTLSYLYEEADSAAGTQTLHLQNETNMRETRVRVSKSRDYVMCRVRDFWEM